MRGIGTNRHTEVATYFTANVESPGWLPWLRNLDKVEDLEVTAGKIPLKVSGLTKLFRSATQDSRVAYATYHWLNPAPAPRPLGLLKPLIRVAGLDHLHGDVLVAAIRTRGLELERQHEPLSMWIRMRLALLEFAYAAPRSPPHDLPSSLLLLRNALLGVMNLMWQDPPRAVQVAGELSKNALRGAAQAAQAELVGDAEGGSLNASLMVPVADLAAAIASLPAPAPEGAERARALWTGLPRDPDRHLVVVSETVRHHVGFWVPVVQGDGGRYLPGGPETYANRIGSAVFKPDLPPLRGFSEALSTRWNAYIGDRVRGTLFVSLPFVVPRQAGGDDLVAAILNVNADVPEGAEWFRAYHPEWLARAREAVAPFIEIAYYAFLAEQQCRGNHPLQLDVDEGAWNTLPGLPALPQLPAAPILHQLPPAREEEEPR